MTTDKSAAVVVGVDGSEPSLAALGWAVGEAVARQARLRVVHAFVWPLYRVELGSSPYGPDEGGLRAAAEGVVNKAVRRARAEAADLQIDGVLHTGPASPSLLTEAAGADLLVVGSRGLGGFTGLLLGSVSSQVVAHADCPIVVVRPQTGTAGRWTGQVVVGVEDLDSSSATVDFAMDEAARLTTGLVIVYCMPQPLATTAMAAPIVAYDDSALAEAEEARFAEAVARLADKHPDVPVSPHFSRLDPARTLVEASTGARLVVVGSRGRGGFTGLLLGSVSRHLLHHAACPVAVLPVGRKHQ